MNKSRDEILSTMRRIKILLAWTSDKHSEKDHQFRRDLRRDYKNLQRELDRLDRESKI